MKSKQGAIGAKIADGAYETMIQRITSNENPDFLVMCYSLNDLRVTDLFMIPKFFFIPEIIEKRAPLSPTARRAGWIGCNILINQIPQQGRIGIISGGVEESPRRIIEKVSLSQKLNTDNLRARGWLMDVLNCVNSIPGDRFELSDLYAFEELLGEKHKGNHNIRPKIRQQLQLLRDRGFIEFTGRGKYEKLSKFE